MPLSYPQARAALDALNRMRPHLQLLQLVPPGVCDAGLLLACPEAAGLVSAVSMVHVV